MYYRYVCLCVLQACLCVYRFVVKLYPSHQSVLSHLEDLGLDESCGGHDSLNGACSDLNQPDSTPFSSQRVMYDNTEVSEFDITGG